MEEASKRLQFVQDAVSSQHRGRDHSSFKASSLQTVNDGKKIIMYEGRY